jgi:hypothetical protein
MDLTQNFSDLKYIARKRLKICHFFGFFWEEFQHLKETILRKITFFHTILIPVALEDKQLHYNYAFLKNLGQSTNSSSMWSTYFSFSTETLVDSSICHQPTAIN